MDSTSFDQRSKFLSTGKLPALLVLLLALTCGPEAAAQRSKTQGAAAHPFPAAQPSPSLEGGLGWINTAGPLDLKHLRGKFVLLDFWTYCCINCLHILPELKKLEAAYPDEIVVIGVHSGKFETEKQAESIVDAVLRYEIKHPVINDAKYELWNRFGVNSWPTFRVIDPEGKLIAGHSGEVDFAFLDRFFKGALPYYKQQGLLDETPLRFDLAAHSAETPLRFPGKLLADEQGGRLFIADSNHNRLVVATLEGKLLHVIGSGAVGAANGDFAAASFNKPQGMALVGQMLYVADTENHLLRKVDLKTRRVKTIAGRGVQSRNPFPGLEVVRQGRLPQRFVGPPPRTALNSPWDLWVHKQDLYIAMAGSHQIWKMPLDESEIGPYAGNAKEDIIDGPLLPKLPFEEGFATFAQPSGLAGDSAWLYVADSEGSSVRAVPFDPAKQVRTVVGTSHLPEGRLFTFGDVDGQGEAVRLQHVLGVTYVDGKLYVADTYNHKIKVIDPEKQASQTIAGSGQRGSSDDPPQFYEPAGISHARGKLYVADTNNHLIRVIDLKAGNKASTLAIQGLAPPALPESKPEMNLSGAKEVSLPVSTVMPVEGRVRLDVQLALPPGWKINPRAPMSYRVQTVAKTGPLDRAAIDKPTKLDEPSEQFTILLPTTGVSGQETLKVSVTYYYCQEGAEGLCKVGAVTWKLPLELSKAGQPAVTLMWKVDATTQRQ